MASRQPSLGSIPLVKDTSGLVIVDLAERIDPLWVPCVKADELNLIRVRDRTTGKILFAVCQTEQVALPQNRKEMALFREDPAWLPPPYPHRAVPPKT